MGDLKDKFEAMLRGGASSATGGWNDEGVAKLLANLPMPGDPEGIPREYAAGSAEQDYRNTERNDAKESERRFPGTFRSGKMLGVMPALMAAGAGGGVAGAGLMGGARGALAGAGNAEEGNRLEGAAKLAGPEALMSMAGAAAPAALGKLKDLFGELPPPPGGLAPAYAGAGAGVSGAAAEEGMPLIKNMMSTIPAPKGGGMRGRGVSSPDEKIIAQDRSRWERENAGEAAREPNVGKPAVPPPAPADPAEAYTPTIPPAGKTGVPSLQRGFQDLVDQDAELAKQAVMEQTRLQKMKRIKPLDMINEADPMQSRAALENDPIWREMNAQIHKQEFNPLARNSPAWRKLPKHDKLPDLAKENAAAEEHAAMLEGIDKIKAKGKGAIQKTKEVETPMGPAKEKQTLRVAPGKIEAEEEDMRSLLGTVPL